MRRTWSLSVQPWQWLVFRNYFGTSDDAAIYVAANLLQVACRNCRRLTLMRGRSSLVSQAGWVDVIFSSFLVDVIFSSFLVRPDLRC